MNSKAIAMNPMSFRWTSTTKTLIAIIIFYLCTTGWRVIGTLCSYIACMWQCNHNLAVSHARWCVLRAECSQCCCCCLSVAVPNEQPNMQLASASMVGSCIRCTTLPIRYILNPGRTRVTPNTGPCGYATPQTFRGAQRVLFGCSDIQRVAVQAWELRPTHRD